MAAAVIPTVRAAAFDEISDAVVFTALDGTDGGLVAWDNKDVHTTILVKNTSEDTNYDLTIAGSDSEYGIEDQDYTIPFGETRAISIESGHFKQVSGDNKGKVVLSGNAALQCVAVATP